MLMCSSSLQSSASMVSTTEKPGDSDTGSNVSDENDVNASKKPEQVSLLDGQKAHATSDLARKGKVHSNPPLGKRRLSG